MDRYCVLCHCYGPWTLKGLLKIGLGNKFKTKTRAQELLVFEETTSSEKRKSAFEKRMLGQRIPSLPHTNDCLPSPLSGTKFHTQIFISGRALQLCEYYDGIVAGGSAEKIMI